MQSDESMEPREGNDEPNDLNYSERAFPVLFPYGTEGLEASQPIPVDFKDHIQWTLQYHDRRF